MTLSNEMKFEKLLENILSPRRKREREFGENAKWDGTVVHAGIDHTRQVSAQFCDVRIRENGRQSTRDRNDDDSSNYFNHFLSFSHFILFLIKWIDSVSRVIQLVVLFFWWRLCGRRGRQSTVKWERTFFSPLFNFLFWTDEQFPVSPMLLCVLCQ